MTVDGRPLAFTAQVPGGFALLRSESTGAMGTDLLRIGVRGNRVDQVAHLRARIPIPAMAVGSGTNIYVENDGTIVRYDLRDGSSLALMSVRSAHHAWNAVGIGPDGSTMYVASEPQQTLTAMPVNADAWLDTACRVAGRKSEPDDFAGLLPNTDRIKMGCPQPSPRLAEFGLHQHHVVVGPPGRVEVEAPIGSTGESRRGAAASSVRRGWRRQRGEDPRRAPRSPRLRRGADADRTVAVEHHGYLFRYGLTRSTAR